MERLNLSKLKPELPLKKRGRSKKVLGEPEVKMLREHPKKASQDKGLVP